MLCQWARVRFQHHPSEQMSHQGVRQIRRSMSKISCDSKPSLVATNSICLIDPQCKFFKAWMTLFPLPRVEPRTSFLLKPFACLFLPFPAFYWQDTSDGRVLFLLPWQKHTIAGTTDSPCEVTESNQPRFRRLSLVKPMLQQLSTQWKLISLPNSSSV